MILNIDKSTIIKNKCSTSPIIGLNSSLTHPDPHPVFPFIFSQEEACTGISWLILAGKL